MSNEVWKLERDFIGDEIYKALFDMEHFKAYKPDKLQATFLSISLGVGRQSVYVLVKEALEGCTFLEACNESLLVLLPKLLLEKLRKESV